MSKKKKGPVRRGRRETCAALVLALLTAIWPEGALAQLTCTVKQITTSNFISAGGSTGPITGNASISADGTRIAFQSNSDFTGGNGDGNVEIYLFDSNTNTTRQITDLPCLPNVHLFCTVASFSPAISADGARIAFLSEGDLTGANPDLGFEVFLFDIKSNTFTQITNTPCVLDPNLLCDFDKFGPSINVDGTRIAFASRADLTGGNPDSGVEIFLFDAGTGTLSQITDSTVGDSAVPFSTPSINAAGTRIAFQSTSDLTGGNPDDSSEIFLFDTTTHKFTQITAATVGGSSAPSLNADGTHIAFQSTSDLTGGNPDGSSEIFLFDTTTHKFTQITAAAAGGSAAPSISADGTHVAFQSTSDLTGGNPDGSFEIFLFDTTTNKFTQITASTTGDSSAPSLNAGGTRIAFQSTSDLTGGNADGNEEIFLAECAPPTVVIGGCDSGVPNVPVSGGGTITDRINQCAAGAKNHGSFVSCVSHLTDDLKKAGIITGAQKGAIDSCAGKAHIP